MKHVILLSAFTVLCSTVHAQSDTSSQQKLKTMEWLLGDWVRSNSKPGTAGFESWKKTGDQGWQGRGWSMKGADTTFVEVLRIITKDNKLYYVADVPENNKPVYFEITSVTQDSFTCENPSHDFPKKIYYHFDGTKIHARVSAGTQGIDFVFERRMK